jgi:lipopolysaccharide/colanic/teichoic acid biosynthesis glycosyltransferase
MAVASQPLKQKPPFIRNQKPRTERAIKHREQTILMESQFVAAVSLERRRTERSSKPFLLMLLELPEMKNGNGDGLKASIISSLVSLTRETDVIGWYEDGVVLGVIFTELGDANKATVLKSLQDRVKTTLLGELHAGQANAIYISFHFYPEDTKSPERAADLNLYPEFSRRRRSNRVAHIVKRSLDIAVGTSALLVLSPLFSAIALLIKATSKGPVLFRQTRIGQYGKPFVFLKFRSMHVNSDPGIHKEYVSQFIAGKAETTSSDGDGSNIYKITNDPRVTPLGRILRKTSLDELPQLLNVLMGEMSLIGPRPPVPYEFEAYDIWHRRRVVEIKPGITGLWQVNGRSRTSFDDMVRLDLQYARAWSLWLDLKILVQTPGAVFSGDGAY